MAKGEAGMDRATKTAVWIVALGVIVTGLYWGREWLTQFAVALILWFAIDGLRQGLEARVKGMPSWASLLVAIVFVLTLVAGLGTLVTQNVGEIAGRLSEQGPRLNRFVAEAYRLAGLAGPAPTVDALLAQADAGALLTAVGAGLQNLVGGVVFILIYLGFLFSAAATFPEKLDRIFPAAADRDEVRLVLTEIRQSMAGYLWVQTVMSLVITGLTLATLLALGMPNAVFYAVLIFFLNYVPTVGSLIAVMLAALAAIVEFDSLAQVALVVAGVSIWQFVVGNFVQPRLTGDQLNLSAVVVLLSLAFWGSLWGIVGAFLSAPLTTMIMVICAQNESMRWIAVLLSEDGRPKILRRPPEPQS
ncbi:MAG: AI-2E family transporter [Hyphomonadaceae bacterium]|nr:AI-2E family transporter [Hyphomonadaceae bacterium]